MNANAVPAPATHERSEQVPNEVTVDGDLRRPEHPVADQRHPDRHHDLGAATGDQRL